MAHPHDSGSAVRFSTMKGANRYMEIILTTFPKKILFRADRPFRTQKGMFSQLWICCKDCFTILHKERGQERHGNFTGFSEKNLIQDNLVILAQKWYSLITFDLLSGFLFSILQEVKKYMKNLLVVFPEKISLGAI